MNRIERGETPPMEEKTPMPKEEIIKMVETGEGLEEWRPTFSELLSLFSIEEIPFKKASKIASEKLDQIIPMADADTYSIVVRSTA